MKRTLAAFLSGALLSTAAPLYAHTTNHSTLHDRTDRARVHIPYDTAEDEICVDFRWKDNGKAVIVVRLINPDNCLRWQLRNNN